MGPNGWRLDLSSPAVQACLMLQVHFDTHQTLIGIPGPRIDYQSFIPHSLESPTDDVAWRNRVVWLCARILQRTGSTKISIHEWHELSSSVDAWESERPASFDTFSCRKVQNVADSVRKLWFSSPCHGMYIQIDKNDRSDT